MFLGKRKNAGGDPAARGRKRQCVFKAADAMATMTSVSPFPKEAPKESPAQARLNNFRTALGGRISPWHKTDDNVVVPLPAPLAAEMRRDGVTDREINEAKRLHDACYKFQWDRSLLTDPQRNPYVAVVQKIKAGMVKDPRSVQDYMREAGERDLYFGLISTSYEVIRSRDVRYDQRLMVTYDGVKPDGEMIGVKSCGRNPYFFTRIPKAVIHEQGLTEDRLQRYAQNLVSRLNTKLQDWACKQYAQRQKELCWVLEPNADPYDLFATENLRYAKLIPHWELMRDCKNMVGIEFDIDERGNLQLLDEDVFIKIEVPHPNLVPPAKEALWLSADWLGDTLDGPFVHHAQGPTDGRKCHMVLDATIPYVTRNIIDDGLTVMGWNRIERGKYQVVPVGRQSTYYRLEIECHYSALSSIHAHPALEAEKDYVPPPLVPLNVCSGFEQDTKTFLQNVPLPHTISSEDAEMCKSDADAIKAGRDVMYSKNGTEMDRFPDERFESIVTWGFDIENLSVANKAYQVGFILGTLAEEDRQSPELKDAFIFEFLDEKTMLEHLHLFKMTLQADIILTYNGANFDLPFLENRLKVLGSQQSAHFGYHVNQRMSWSNITVRGRNKTSVCTPGAFCYDLLKQMPSVYQFSDFKSFSLSYVSKRLLEQTKIDCPYSMIRRMHHMQGSRAKLLIYCLRDCALPRQVVKKYRLLATHDARMMATEPQYLIDRGSMFRLLNCVMYFSKVLSPKLFRGRRLLLPAKWAPDTERWGGTNDAAKEFMATAGVDETAFEEVPEEFQKTKAKAGKKAKYKGAFNFDPPIDRDTGEEAKNFFEGCTNTDDFVGLYPSTMMEFNQCPTTMILTKYDRDRLNYRQHYKCYLEADMVAQEPDACETDPDWNEIPEEEKQRRRYLRRQHPRRKFVVREYTPDPACPLGPDGVPLDPRMVMPERAAFMSEWVQESLFGKVMKCLKALRDKLKVEMGAWAFRRDTIGGTATIFGIKKALNVIEAYATGAGGHGGMADLHEAFHFIKLMCTEELDIKNIPKESCRLKDVPPEFLAELNIPADVSIEDWVRQRGDGFLRAVAFMKLWAQEEYAKAVFEHGVCNARQDSVKKIMNSIYGMCGSKYGPCPLIEVALTTTQWGVFFIKFCMCWIEENYRPDKGCPYMLVVVYGDTDSMMVYHIPILNWKESMDYHKDAVMKAGRLEAEAINKAMRDKFGVKYMKIDFEKMLFNMVLDAKKKYMAEWRETNGKNSFKVKGMHCVRADCSDFNANLQRDVMKPCIVEGNFEKGLNIAIERLSKIVNHEVMNCDIMGSKGFSKDPEKYTSAAGHVECARRHAKKPGGKRYRAGMRMKTIVVKPDYFPGEQFFEAREKVTKRHEEVLYALDNHMLYDEDYYVKAAWKMIRRPLWRVSPYKTMDELDARVFGDPRMKKRRGLMSVSSRQEVLQQELGGPSMPAPAAAPKSGKLTSFFRKDESKRCRVCGTICTPGMFTPVGQVSVCQDCHRDGGLEEYVEGLQQQLDRMQQSREQCWDECAKCLGNLGLAPPKARWNEAVVTDIEDIAEQCVADDCNNLYLRKQSRDEVLLITSELAKLGIGASDNLSVRRARNFSVDVHLLSQVPK